MICVSLGNISFGCCLELLETLQCAEIRLDLMDLTPQEVKQVFSVPCSLVATCRPGKYPLEERINLLTNAIQHGARYVDVEYEADDRLKYAIKKEAKEKGVTLIISYHDFLGTPSFDELEQIIIRSRDMGADLVKIATMANNQDDCATLLGLYHKHKDIIAFGMGQQGMITRIAAPLLGAEFTFAALDEDTAIAPGQLSLQKLHELYRTLKVND